MGSTQATIMCLSLHRNRSITYTMCAQHSNNNTTIIKMQEYVFVYHKISQPQPSPSYTPTQHIPHSMPIHESHIGTCHHFLRIISVSMLDNSDTQYAHHLCVWVTAKCIPYDSSLEILSCPVVMLDALVSDLLSLDYSTASTVNDNHLKQSKTL